MARLSQTEHVRKVCRCSKWKECTHPWYVWYREGSGAQQKNLRGRLSRIAGREPVDYADAVDEARRAITAWKDGRDACELQPGDAPTITVILDAYGQRPGGAPLDRYQ